MDQIKIGRFIAQLRKEQNMTQLELATKIGVTDRAISKWENGRGLPDLSLIKPLCEALNISVNELLCGERIEENNISQKAEENIINTLNYSRKSINKTKIIFSSILIGILGILIILTACFAIDIDRMRKNLPVVFSTWGIKYAPPINLDEENIELAIKEYLINKGDSEEKHHPSTKTFIAFRTYLIEETEKESKYNVYAWVVCQKHYLENSDIKIDSGYSMPHKFVLEKQSDTFIVTESRIPRDGTYYAEDMKNIFPKSVINDMDNVYSDGTIDRLEMQIDEQLKLYFHSVS